MCDFSIGNQDFMMIRTFRQLAAALAISLGFAAPASATAYSVDFTDLWYIPAESGWGFNVIQQGNTLFGTLFVYGNDQSARWFVASDMKPQTAPSGQAKFGGKLYQTTGPFFGAGAFNPAQVGVTEVGDISITFPTASTATLVYNVGTATVTKSVTRQTFVADSPAGQYFGGMTTQTSACADARNNGGFAHFIGGLTAAITGSNVTFRIDYNTTAGGVTCNFSGTWSQQGRLATVSNGIWSCIGGTTVLNNGQFSLAQVDVQVNGITANVTASDQICTYTGRFGGIRAL